MPRHRRSKECVQQKHLQRLRKLGPDAEILQTLQSSTGSIVGASFNDRSTPEADEAELTLCAKSGLMHRSKLRSRVANGSVGGAGDARIVNVTGIMERARCIRSHSKLPSRTVAWRTQDKSSARVRPHHFSCGGTPYRLAKKLIAHAAL